MPPVGALGDAGAVRANRQSTHNADYGLSQLRRIADADPLYK